MPMNELLLNEINHGMASALFGNSPQVAMSNYYGGANLMDAKDILEQRKYLRFG